MEHAELIVKETEQPTYPTRTAYNAKSSDLTLAFAIDLTTKGELLTKKLAGDKYMGFKLEDDTNSIDLARQIYKRMKKDNVHTLNIAGNGIYTLKDTGCTQEFINQFVYEILAKIHEFLPITRIYTGGQTGVDIAGAVAGYALNIPTEVTLPKGFLQRNIHHKDVYGTSESVAKQVTDGAEKVLENLHTAHETPKKKNTI
jgi:hypothetical protein